jgi:hypothetical protein
LVGASLSKGLTLSGSFFKNAGKNFSDIGLSLAHENLFIQAARNGVGGLSYHAAEKMFHKSRINHKIGLTLQSPSLNTILDGTTAELIQNLPNKESNETKEEEQD